MKMTFFPGKLELVSKNGAFAISVEGREVFRARSQAVAVEKFNEIRIEMEKQFPPTGPTAGDSKVLLERLLTDIRVDDTLRRERKKPSTARSSRTFGR
jgi:hypothetical protein